MVLFPLNKFSIMKLGRFDLCFWQTSKQIYRIYKTSDQVYREVQYEEKCFGKFQKLPHFLRKMVLYLLSKFSINQSCTKILSLRIFDIDLLETLKRIFRSVQYENKFFGKYYGLPSFTIKMVLYSRHKFYIFESYNDIQWLRRIHLGF